MSQPLRAGCERSLRVEHAPIIDRLQLPKVIHKNHRDVAKRAVVRVWAALAEVRSFALLRADMHAREQSRTDEGDLVNNQQKHILPDIL